MLNRPNIFKELLERKREASRASSGTGILKDPRLANQHRPGEKPQPKLRRGGRNGSGKP